MSLRLEMLQVARLSPKILGDSRDLVVDFLQSSINPDGGFQNRIGESDLYYTVFGIEALIALNASLPVEKVARYLESFGHGESLDFVHLASLARCWAGLRSFGIQRHLSSKNFQEQIELYRMPDGGYNQSPDASNASAYANYLAFGMYQDIEEAIPNAKGIFESFEQLRSMDGAYGNLPHMPFGTTTSTAAAVSILRNGDRPVDPSLGDWLLHRFHPEGGFYPVPSAPLPDLLSTATALNALERLKVPLDGIREACLDFIDTLWCSKGGFYGHWADDHLDCEYTYYGLLALGHLSL